MNSRGDSNSNFIEQWLKSRKGEAALDQRILSLIDKHREGSELDEAALLKSLFALAREVEHTNGPD